MNKATSYDVRIHAIREDERAKRRPYRVRWVVANRPRFSRYFATAGLANSFHSKLTTAAKEGEAFDLETGLPVSMLRQEQHKEAADNAVSWLQHLREYAAHKWPRVAGKSRKGMADVLRDVMVAVLPKNTRRSEWQPEYEDLSEALRLWVFRPGVIEEAGDDIPVDILDAIGWAEEHSPSLGEATDLATVRRILDVLSRKQDGQQAAANYFNRRRAMLYNVYARAITQKRLDVNPLDAPDLDWDRPNDLQTDDVVDPRSVGNTVQVEGMLTAVSYIGREQGFRFVAFFGCMYYAMMRPEEVVNLKRNQCELPEAGWGRLVLEKAAPAVGRQWTDDGETHEERALKHRGRGATRPVPIPSRLVALLRTHIRTYRVRPGARLFNTVHGNPIDSGVYGRVWQAARVYGLSEDERTTPRLKRPYDLRHSGVSLRRTAGVPSKQVAEWAGHSVEVLERIYSKVLEGYDDRWQRQIDDFMSD